DALMAYRTTTALDPVYFDAWFAQGRLLEQAKEFTAAVAAYDRAANTDPTAAAPVMAAALLQHYALHDPAGAVARYNAVLARDPNHYGAHFQLAQALAQAGRPVDAEAAWRAFVPLAERIGDRASLARPPVPVLPPAP